MSPRVHDSCSHALRQAHQLPFQHKFKQQSGADLASTANTSSHRSDPPTQLAGPDAPLIMAQPDGAIHDDVIEAHDDSQLTTTEEATEFLTAFRLTKTSAEQQYLKMLNNQKRHPRTPHTDMPVQPTRSKTNTFLYADYVTNLGTFIKNNRCKTLHKIQAACLEMENHYAKEHMRTALTEVVHEDVTQMTNDSVLANRAVHTLLSHLECVIANKAGRNASVVFIPPSVDQHLQIGSKKRVRAIIKSYLHHSAIHQAVNGENFVKTSIKYQNALRKLGFPPEQHSLS